MNSIILTRLNLALLAAVSCVTLAGFWLLPVEQQLPVHWNRYGIIDAWAPRENALLLIPAFTAAMTVCFWIFGRWIVKVDELRGSRQYALGLSSTLAIFLLLQVLIIVHGLGYLINTSRVIALVAAFFFIAIGNILPKAQPSARPFSWPKALDAAEQHRLKRLTGGVMLASGFGLMVASLCNVPPLWLNCCTLLAALAPAAAGVTYSLLLSSAHASHR